MLSHYKRNLFKRTILYLAIIAFVSILIYYFVIEDSKLRKPDFNGQGYNLTPLGSLLYGPWHTEFDKYNVTIDSNGKELSSSGQYFTEQQKSLTFLLKENGSVQYWFINDDSKDTQRAGSNSNGVSNESQHNQKTLGIKKYTGGLWKVDFKDSSLSIDFGKNDFNLSPLIGKYAELGSNTIYFKQISFFDTILTDNKVTLRKVISTRFTH